MQMIDVGLIYEQVRDYLRQNFLFGADVSDLDDSASLIEQGVVDGTGVLELVLFVEETYGLTVEEQDLVPEHFDSVNNIVAYVAERLG